MTRLEDSQRYFQISCTSILQSSCLLDNEASLANMVDRRQIEPAHFGVSFSQQLSWFRSSQFKLIHLILKVIISVLIKSIWPYMFQIESDGTGIHCVFAVLIQNQACNCTSIVTTSIFKLFKDFVKIHTFVIFALLYKTD